jgi:hypothetical protein
VRKKAQIIEPRGLQMRNVKSACFTVACALGLLGTAASSAHAVTFSASSGTLAASAEFTIVGGNLNVVLTNTSTFDVVNPPQVLTAVFFDVGGVGALTPLSATLSGASTVFFDAPPPGGVVGGEWAYGSGLAGAPGGATEGISSAGFGLFGGTLFPGANLDGPVGVNGLNYGITSAGDNPLTGNAEVTGNAPLIQNAVLFTLSCPTVGGCAASILDSIIKVSFQYGTALTEPNLVPLPPALVLFGTALVGMGVLSRRRRTKVAA